MRETKTLFERLDSHINKQGPNDCWPWGAGVTPKGYGTIKVWNGCKWVTSYAHREVLKLHAQEPPAPNNQVLHSCDNPSCCNPQHLSWGNESKNRKEARDRLHNQGKQKLVPKQVEDIRGDTRKYADIANSYSVHVGTVARIKQGRSWKPT